MLPRDAKERKDIPIYSGFIKYFPKTMIAVTKLSMIGNEQHNPGQPLHWDKSKSTDQLDTLIRHLMESGTLDGDRVPHDVKIAWRACANCETYLAEHPWEEPVAAILEFIAKQKAEHFDEDQRGPLGNFGKPNPNIASCTEAVTTAWQEPVDADTQYCVCFRDDQGDGVVYVTYKGPFYDVWTAEEYAHRNPHNIAGLKTIHALNRP